MMKARSRLPLVASPGRSSLWTRRGLVGAAVTIVLPLFVAGLWLASGREVLTKSSRYVEVAVADELFGGTLTEKRLVAGPVFGYYIGLDLVLVAAAVGVLGGAVWWWLTRRPHADGVAHEV